MITRKVCLLGAFAVGKTSLVACADGRGPVEDELDVKAVVDEEHCVGRAGMSI